VLAPTTYVPGLCNIGPAERARRLRQGFAGVVTFAVLAVVLVVTGSGPWSYLVLFLPAYLAAIGFIQAAHRFCVGYGWRGVIGFGALNQTEAVESDADRRRDRTTAKRLTGLALVIAGGVTLVAFGLAMALG
jgi:hypothetical protein